MENIVFSSTHAKALIDAENIDGIKAYIKLFFFVYIIATTYTLFFVLIHDVFYTKCFYIFVIYTTLLYILINSNYELLFSNIE